jgi:hypothetical protein
MRLEKPLRRSKTMRHRFIRSLFQAACDPEVDYNTIVRWLKLNYKVCVTVAEVRQLVLYCGLFGQTDSLLPMKETVRYVLKHCVMSVPRLHMFKRWCKDVKRLERCPDLNDRSKGYFSSANRDDETCTIQSLIEDFQSYDDMDSEVKGDTIVNDDDDSVDSASMEEVKLADKLKKGIRSIMTLNKLGFMANQKKKEKPYVHRRKRGNANVYALGGTNQPEFNKFIASLNKGGDPKEDIAKGVIAKDLDDLENKFQRRARCTDSLFVKKIASGNPNSVPVETEPEVDVDIILDIMKETMGGGGQGSSPQHNSSSKNPPLRQSMAVMVFNQNHREKKSKSKKKVAPETVTDVKMAPLPSPTATTAGGDIDDFDGKFIGGLPMDPF